MPRLVLTPAALRHLMEIANSIENASGSVDTAERFVDRLVRQCEKLASLSGLLGRARPELLPELRSFPYGTYVIFFHYAGPPAAPDTFEVANILHGCRDIDAYFAQIADGDC